MISNKDKTPTPVASTKIEKRSPDYTAKDLDKASPELRSLGLALLAKENAVQEAAKQELDRFTKTVRDRVNKELEHIRRQKLTVAEALKRQT